MSRFIKAKATEGPYLYSLAPHGPYHGCALLASNCFYLQCLLPIASICSAFWSFHVYQYGLINIFLRRYRLRGVTAVIVDTCIYSNKIEYIYIMYRRKWVNQTVFSSTCFEGSMLGAFFFEFNQSDSVADDDATGPSRLSRSLSLSPYGDVTTVESALL